MPGLMPAPLNHTRARRPFGTMRGRSVLHVDLGPVVADRITPDFHSDKAPADAGFGGQRRRKERVWSGSAKEGFNQTAHHSTPQHTTAHPQHTLSTHSACASPSSCNAGPAEAAPTNRSPSALDQNAAQRPGQSQIGTQKGLDWTELR
ncbi:hypothetical protein E4U43_005825 [Claviceps pusilla]|uniref:Uncharacterized protein n=1 Tax=Claviceps pusilla TaxID=123648 RepID=A0A9P7N1L7_9HYPO|nr:hypothetical protein E4U43_005825 [Claviceps pusilla]